ncbi:YaaA family protein [Desulfobulbus sp.]|uniref:YaaA family protein n=1 Tax=Desulfobulbus sp. TaxID=895 RepID=UPI0027B9E05C|nr:YaaA family protein [Desulfobulbus sp.]
MIILSSSKGQDFTPVDCSLPTTRPAFLDQARQLITLLRQYDLESLKLLMGASQALTERTHAQIHAFAGKEVKPAILAYSGEAYRSLDAGGLTSDDLEYAQQRLRILSGLYGMLRPFDLIRPHRLEMGCALANDQGKNLYAFWSKRITDGLNKALAQEAQPLLINLASHEYAKTVEKNRIKGRWLDIQFKEETADGLKNMAVHAKRARGLMAAYLIRNRIERAEDIKQFNGGGYVYQPELSTDRHFAFTRPLD